MKKPHELFLGKPHIASRHSVVINDIRYIGFKPTDSAAEPINFRGIPYANSTAGNQRLAAPTPYVAAQDEIDCTAFGPACWQDPVGMRMVFEGLLTMFREIIFPSTKVGHSKAYGQFSEDCLNLNLWTPALDDQKRAVMVWIHGGAFKSGSNSELGLYNGTHLSHKGDVVVVSINYRFGLFALHLPDEGISNIALQDQIFALQWIEEHIAKFGGDPNNVTIFGESAGGISVANLLASSKAKGLFHKAICQSGGGLSLTPEEYQRVFNTAAEQLKKATKGEPLTADHIRSVESPRDLVKVSGKVDEALEAFGTTKIGYLPLRDGTHVDAEGVLSALKKGAGSQVPLLVGSNTQEMQLFIAAFGPLFPTNQKMVTRGIRQLLDQLAEGESAEEAHAVEVATTRVWASFSESLAEKAGKVPSKRALLEACVTFLTFTLPSYQLAEAHVQGSGGQVYSYLLHYGSEKFGACHGVDLHLLWNFGAPYEEYFCKGKVNFLPDYQDQQVALLADEMQRAWIHFAKTGTPAAVHQKVWEPFPSRMNLDLTSFVDSWDNDGALQNWFKIEKATNLAT